MPRTKRAAATKVAESKNANDSKLHDLLKKRIDEEEQKNIDMLEKQLQEELTELQINCIAIKTKFPSAMLSRTMTEIQNGDVEDSQLSVTHKALSDLTNTMSSTRLMNTTKSAKKSAKSIRSSSSSSVNKTKVAHPRLQRSISMCCDDEGYTTAESTRGTSGDSTRQSRSRTKPHVIVPESSTRSRSSSKQNTTKKSSVKTPANKQPVVNNSGTITPKCKPNTPLLYVRRPKVGEMAWSNQGSPLLVTGTVAAEKTANVNIPVGGDILSMMPTRGPMRESQIPDVDEATRQQLEILRDHLIKVCKTIHK